MMGSEKMIPNQATLIRVEEPEFDCNRKTVDGNEEIKVGQRLNAQLNIISSIETQCLLLPSPGRA